MHNWCLAHKIWLLDHSKEYPQKNWEALGEALARHVNEQRPASEAVRAPSKSSINDWRAREEEIREQFKEASRSDCKRPRAPKFLDLKEQLARWLSTQTRTIYNPKLREEALLRASQLYGTKAEGFKASDTWLKCVRDLAAQSPSNHSSQLRPQTDSMQWCANFPHPLRQMIIFCTHDAR